ncbi:MAG TPA: hypothetical protein PLI43_08580 [Albidovulum sp.]|uniref:hypothetical protein n=1 Tax=Albidovulum sp. TaxID=1872424 RepID=UPI002D1BE9EF|nr:hypothetical protein [Albidovulum sp.]
MRRLAGMTALAVMLMTPFAGPAVAKTDYARQCLREVGAKGGYGYAAGETAPVVKPLEGGTQAEADQVNACIRSKAAGGQSAGMMRPVAESSAAPKGVATQSAASTPYYTKKQRGASVLSGGAGYHGAVMEGGTSYAGEVQTKPTKKRKKAPRGLMNLPSGYPMMPGDEDLWYSLTLAQQQRALQFLQDGSTIRSSLEPD